MNIFIQIIGFLMNETKLSDNLQQLMRIHGNITVSELARLTNLPQPTIHHILSGATKNPRAKALEALSDYFSVTIKQLLGQEHLPTVIPDAIKENLQISTIPIIKWDMLRDWPLIEVKNAQKILLDRKLAINSFALVLQDASMEPTFQQNSVLIFDSEKIPKDRDYVVTYLVQKNTIVFNRLFIENNEKYIKESSGEGNFNLTKLDNNDRIIGTLIETRVPY